MDLKEGSRMCTDMLFKIFWRSACALTCAIQISGAQEKPAVKVQPLSPDEAYQSIHVPVGFVLDLVASEPLVLDPVAFDWDTKGRLWVVEMADYPLGLGDNNAAGGRIRLLEDRDSDGTMDHATLFAEGLNFPNGIITWRDGVIVTAAPDILFLRDTTGDGEADSKEVLLTGLTEGNQQLRANGLRWGLDNWVYVATGGHHGKYGIDTKIRSTRADAEVKIGSRDFRFRPDTGEVEPQSGPTQFGRNRDDWGHWFGTQNSRPLWHYVLPDHYLRRNLHFAAPEGRVLIPGQLNPPVAPKSLPQKRFHSLQHSGHYTSACSGMIFRGTLFSENEINGFACEPFHNLAQRIKIEDDGGSYKGARYSAEGDPDFFASSDRWCRPVMIRNGPDGNLWVADMYRYVIEHMQWLKTGGKEELEPLSREGDDRGRIWRVRKAGSKPAAPLDLEKADLVDLLKSPNGWVRDKAQQLILWRNEISLVTELKKLAAEGTDPRARLHAICTLDGLGKLSESAILTALRDSHPGVRENALRLAESHQSPEIVNAALALVEDPAPKVRLQLAFSIGEFTRSKQTAVTLVKILNSERDRPFFVAAGLSSILPNFASVVPELEEETIQKLRAPLVEIAIGIKDSQLAATLIQTAFDETSATVEMLEILSRTKLEITDLKIPELNSNFEKLIEKSKSVLANEDKSIAHQIESAALLARVKSHRQIAIDFLAGKIAPTTPPEDFKIVLKTLASTADPGVPTLLLEKWPGLSPQVRGPVIDQLLSRVAWTNQLLAALESKTILPSDLDLTRQTRLLKNPNSNVRDRAGKILKSINASPRGKIVADFKPALELKGDAEAGLAVFQKACIACHKHGEIGDRELGPDLATVVDHEPEKLLANILDPNLDIQPGFHSYNCLLKTGEQLFGLIASENGTSITLKLPDGSTRGILRTNIASLRSANVSLMPEGLEGAISKQEMADLIVFLKVKK